MPPEIILAAFASGPAIVLISKLLKASIERAVDRRRTASRVEAARADIERETVKIQPAKDGLSPELGTILYVQRQELSKLPAAPTYHAKGG